MSHFRRTKCPGALVCQTDRLKVRQILLDLAGNALDFKDAGVVAVRLERCDSARGEAESTSCPRSVTEAHADTHCRKAHQQLLPPRGSLVNAFPACEEPGADRRHQEGTSAVVSR
jgi:hypothetical protein